MHDRMAQPLHLTMEGTNSLTMSYVSAIHSDVILGLVPTWSDISDECHSLNGGTCSVTRNTQPRTESHSNTVRGLVPSMVRCKGWATLSWWEDWFLPCSDVSAEPFWGDCEMCSHMIRYKRWRPFSGRMEVPGQLPKILSLGLRAILMWLWDVFIPHDHI